MELESTLTPPGIFATSTANPAGNVALPATQLVAAHQQMVYRIAYSVLRNHSDAEDAAQETFLRVFRTTESQTQIVNLKAWIARIAWNAALDRKRRSRSAAAEVPVEDLARGVETLRHQGRSPEEIAVNGQMQRLLAQLIESLPEKLRQPLQLSTVEDLEHREIAAAMGLTEAAVRARLFQARQKLKEKLERVLGAGARL
jgi:RNA polymerase sigma-70 factor, ECF subfamily